MSWVTITGELSEHMGDNWVRENPLKRRPREETAGLAQPQ